MKNRIIRVTIIAFVLLLSAAGFDLFSSMTEVCCSCDGGTFYERKCPWLKSSSLTYGSGGYDESCYNSPVQYAVEKCEKVWFSQKDKPVCGKVCSPAKSLSDYPIGFSAPLDYDGDIPCENCDASSKSEIYWSYAYLWRTAISVFFGLIIFFVAYFIIFFIIDKIKQSNDKLIVVKSIRNYDILVLFCLIILAIVVSFVVYFIIRRKYNYYVLPY